MKTDLEALDYDELVELNHRIVERLRFLDSIHTHNKMMQFSPGNKVCFDPPNRETRFGTICRYNRETVTVITDTGQNGMFLLICQGKPKTRTAVMIGEETLSVPRESDNAAGSVEYEKLQMRYAPARYDNPCKALL